MVHQNRVFLRYLIQQILVWMPLFLQKVVVVPEPDNPLSRRDIVRALKLAQNRHNIVKAGRFREVCKRETICIGAGYGCARQ